MTLRITEVEFKDFRSYESLRLEEIGPLTIFVGPNAIGKTNIVEGIQLLTALSSFRHASTDQLIRKGAQAAFLSVRMTDGNRLLETALSVEARVKRFSLNGKPKRSSDLRGLAPSIVFTPDDLDLVKGPMSERRAAVDALGAQVNANYHRILKDYEKIVRHKNKLLKEEASPLLLDSINEMLLTCGTQLTCYREALFAKLVPLMKQRYEEVAGKRESFEAYYAPSWVDFDLDSPVCAEMGKEQVRASLERALWERRSEEMHRRRAVVGPHHDEMYFTLNGMNAALFGSQGQQRSIVLSFKLAEAVVVEDILSQKPVLLLDDVMSELDGARREALVGYLSNDVQTFITTANLAYFDKSMLEGAHVIELPFEK